MMAEPLRAVLVGAGRIGATYADDARLATTYRYVSHAQVLAERDDIDWVAVVDPSQTARDAVQSKYGIEHAVASVADLPADCMVDIAVLATPPANRRGDLEGFPGLKGAMVEKPLGRDVGEAEDFADLCRERDIAVQVNYWRRSDEFFRSLADGGLESRVGVIQFINGVYCNGFMNNASHIVDFVRMLAGDVVEARALGARNDGEITGLALTMTTGVTATLHAVDADCYRENGLEIWGREGRLSILVEGLANSFAPRRESRTTAGDFEIATDASELLPSTVGEALGRVWANFIAHLRDGIDLDCPLASALATERVLAASLESQNRGGIAVCLGQAKH